MRKVAIHAMIALTLVGCGIGRGSFPRVRAARSIVGLEKALKERIARDSTAVVGVSVVDLESGLRLGINDTISMHAASTMKVPIMIEAFRQAEHTRSGLEELIPIKNQFTSIADGSTYSLSPSDDSDSTLYRMVGGQLPLRDLVRVMIVRSSNLAANILIERVTPQAIARTLDQLDAPGMRVLRGVEDAPAFQRGLNNTTTADGFARALEGIARCRITSREACDEMIEILAAQEFNDMIPKGIPVLTRVAHKTGWITGIEHDGAIVFPRGQKPYVLVILTRGIQDRARAQRLGADLSAIVWDALATQIVAGPTTRNCPIGSPPERCRR